MSQDLYAVAEHLARHGRGGRVSQALWAHVERQQHPFKIIYDDSGDPYLLRVYQTEHKEHVLGESVNDRAFPALYLHYFFRGDHDRELHDHPWRWSASLILTGGYSEQRLVGSQRYGRIVERTLRPGAINILRHNTFHHVRMLDGTCWTLFMTGPRVPEVTRGDDWGFLDSATREYESWGDREARVQAARRAMQPWT